MASFRFHRDEAVAAELRRIAAARTDRALHELAEKEPHEAIHQARRRCKQVRALLRLVRGEAEELYRRENVAYRDIARRIAPLRDTSGLIEAFDLMAAGMADVRRFSSLRQGLVEHRDAFAAGRLEAAIDTVVADLAAARARIDSWRVPADGFEALAAGLTTTYRRARDRMADPHDRPGDDAFHEWRKRVKDHRYQVRLLQDCWQGPMAARRTELHRLSDLLGVDHDLAGLRAQLIHHPDRYGGTEIVSSFTVLLDRHRAQLQRDASQLGRRCFAEPPKRFVRRIRGYWDVWQQEGASDEARGLAAVSRPPRARA